MKGIIKANRLPRGTQVKKRLRTTAVKVSTPAFRMDVQPH